MKNSEIIAELHRSLEDKDFEKAGSMLADDFVCEIPTQRPMNKQEYIASQKNLVEAVTDFHYNLSDLKQDGKGISGSTQITGRHSGALDLSFMDGPIVPATGVDINLTRGSFNTTIENGKIKKVAFKRSDSAAVPGVLKAIGFNLPKAPK